MRQIYEVIFGDTFAGILQVTCSKNRYLENWWCPAAAGDVVAVAAAAAAAAAVCPSLVRRGQKENLAVRTLADLYIKTGHRVSIQYTIISS